MISYRICGFSFQSNIPIPELPPAGEGQPEFTFQLCPDRQDVSEARQWFNHWYSMDGSKWLSFAKLETGYLLRFPKLVDFQISTDACNVYGYLQAKCPLETMRHLLLNQVVPILLSHLGRLVLHASACATPQGVLAFMGMTGTGKSTLAASFGQRGCPILTDDCLLVEEHETRIMAVPSYPGLRLWPESVEALFEEEPALQPLAHYTEKKRLLFDQEQIDGWHSLNAIYVLTHPEHLKETPNISIAPLTASEAFMEIVKHTFQLDINDRDKLGQAFKRYEWLAKSMHFFRLAIPRDHALLPNVNQAILDHFELHQQLDLRTKHADQPRFA